MRAVALPGGPPYRQQPATAELERVVEPASLERIVAALDAAGLRYQRLRRGFELVGRNDRAMRVRVPDPDRVLPDDLRCETTAPELLLDLALALVPLFGPLLADVRFVGSMLIDGRRDRGELGEEAARAIEQLAARMAVHAPLTFPILVDLVRRMRG